MGDDAQTRLFWHQAADAEAAEIAMQQAIKALTPARRAVLMGLYEGRRLVRLAVSRRLVWSDGARQHPGPVYAAVRQLWVAPRPGGYQLTDSGRALAERLAREG